LIDVLRHHLFHLLSFQVVLMGGQEVSQSS